MKNNELTTSENLIENLSFQTWVLSGRVSNNEEWAAIQADNQAIVEEAALFVETFQFGKKALPNQEIDLEWSKLESRLSTPSIQNQPRITRRLWIRGVAAAVAVVLVATSSFLFFNKNNKSIVQSTDFGERMDMTLSDASFVKLNSNSKIEFKEKWGKNEERVVSLNGEAFFDIKKSPSKTTFKVATNYFTVEVLGTQFDVLAREDKASVVLKEGKIKVWFDKKVELVANGTITSVESVNLLPNECLRLSNQKYYKTTVNTSSHIAWLDEKLVLNNTPLSELASIIKDLYGYEIIFQTEELKSIQINGTLPIQNLKGLLLSIEKGGFGISIQKANEKQLKFVKQ
jgi:ferric-dicitrate binding protein FerR (iron transport regulator)